MLREFVHQLLGITTQQIVWQDYLVALVGAAIFLMLLPVLRGIFFSLKKSARIAKTAALVTCMALAASWIGIVLDVFGYLMTMTIILPTLGLILIGNITYLFLTKEA